MDSIGPSSPNRRMDPGGADEHNVPFSQSSRNCSICAGTLPQVQAGLAACGAFPAEHVYCVVCLTTAVVSDSRCPLCREDLHEIGLVLGDTGETIFPDHRRPHYGESEPPAAEFDFTQELNAMTQPGALGGARPRADSVRPLAAAVEVEVIEESQVVPVGPRPFMRPTVPKGRAAPFVSMGSVGFPHLSPKSGGGPGFDS